jgi:hypothetical protein
VISDLALQVEYLEETPTCVQLVLKPLNATRAVLVLPILYSDSLPDIFEIEAKNIDAKRVEAKEVNFKGLKAYIIFFPSVNDLIYINFYLKPSYLIIIFLYLIYEMLPLFILLLLAITFMKNRVLRKV